MGATLPEGTIFAGRYRVGRPLAVGGMGAVYEVVHLQTDRRRALKIMHAHLFESDEMRERFAREARIGAGVESEFIVDVSDAGVDSATKTPFLVMELLRGEELGERLKRLGSLPPDEVLTYMRQAAMALDRTHAQSIIHRDLKPANLFLTQRDDGTPRIKILDFGVAKVVADGVTGTAATQMLGTPLYMAPEQFRLGDALTPAADVYALGMMVYTLLVGEPYWKPEARLAGDPIAFVMAIAQGPQEPASLRAAMRGVFLPAGFDAWFRRVTALDPTTRFAKASEAIHALGLALGATTGQQAPAPPPALFASPPGVAPGADPGSYSYPRFAPTAGARLSAASGVAHEPSSLALLERAATSTGAAMTPAPVERRRAPLAAILAVVGLLAVGAAVRIGLNRTNSQPVVLAGASLEPPAPAPSLGGVELAPLAAAPTSSAISSAPVASTGHSGPAPLKATTAPILKKKPSNPLLTRD